MGSWVLGEDAVDAIVAVATRYRNLNRAAWERATGTTVEAYVPWLAVPAPPSQFDRSLTQLPGNNRGQIVADPRYLRAIRNLLHDPHTNPVGRVVSTDIAVEVDVDPVEHVPQAVEVIDAARSLLARAMPWMGSLYDELVDCVIPIFHRKSGVPTKRGFSSPVAFGAIFLTLEDRNWNTPWANVELAVDLAHELGHHVLYAYQSADTILSSDQEEPIYSGVRKTLRPAIMSLHASMALAYMIAAGRGLENIVGSSSGVTEKLHLQAASQMRDQRRALAELLTRCRFTELGFAIATELVEQIVAD